MKLLASIYLLCGFAMGKAPHKKEDLEQMNEEQRHDFDKNIMLDTTDDVSNAHLLALTVLFYFSGMGSVRS